MEADGIRKDWKICAVDGYPLLQDPDCIGQAGEWIHRRRDLADHIVVPVGVGEITWNQRCDFCDLPEATDVIYAKDFPMPFGELNSIGHWAACEQCAEMVRRHRWSQLATHVKQNSASIKLRRTPRKGLLQIYDALEQNMAGEVITMAEFRVRSTEPLD